MENLPTFTTFLGDAIVARGDLSTVLRATQAVRAGDRAHDLLMFDDATGRWVDLDARADHVANSPAPAHEAGDPMPAASAGRGRPRLGVKSREVTLLPRHWEWLEQQPNGTSAALRRLVDEARRQAPDGDRARRAREACHRFMTAMAGDRPGYEEALRALFAGDRARFLDEMQQWPKDVRVYAEGLAAASF